ncbi:tetratricopeptide repeat protein [Hufsiella ginkgonis]|uniref:Tetratricopeptide repeat protein n=1 Tax=Hufsiella ginkgonis TaxID=2695274 RepID=A0A7K1Y1G0_9SPHI|nr:tetratricopeptide repeat protein [Hufsiella ginkgonis]MXV16918.1 tetratricopeptide repeat protein [Hufsiella ginkgonis]
MEILKKTLIVSFIVMMHMGVRAQSASVLQKAFQNSYNNETKKNYAAAISDITPYYSENNYEVNIRLGWLNYLNKNYTASQNYYQRAVTLKPNSIEARFGYVKPLSLLTNWNNVLDQYNAILKIDPQNTQANYWAGVIYYNRKQYPNAIKLFSKVVALYPFDYDGNHMLGWANLMTGKKEEARALFEKALLINPGDTSSLDGLSKSR